MAISDQLREWLLGIKNSSFLIAFLALAIYMLDRAFIAIIYPSESTILTQAEQNDGSQLYLLELGSVTSFATNSILFPILLLIFYRLAKGKNLALLSVPLILHYLSVAVVSSLFIYLAHSETKEFLSSSTDYISETGERYRWHYNENKVFNENLDYFYLTEGEDGRYFILKMGIPSEADVPDSERTYLTKSTPKLFFRQYFELYYTPVILLVFVIISALSLPYIYRVNFDTLFENESENDKD